MMATATIVGWTFVNIYEKYVNVKLKLNLKAINVK